MFDNYKTKTFVTLFLLVFIVISSSHYVYSANCEIGFEDENGNCVQVQKTPYVDFSINKDSLNSTERLTANVEFIDFGNIPAVVELVFSIIDNDLNLVYNERTKILVDGLTTFSWDFNISDLTSGKYAVHIKAIHDFTKSNVFEKEFIISNPWEETNGQNELLDKVNGDVNDRNHEPVKNGNNGNYQTNGIASSFFKNNKDNFFLMLKYLIYVVILLLIYVPLNHYIKLLLQTISEKKKEKETYEKENFEVEEFEDFSGKTKHCVAVFDLNKRFKRDLNDLIETLSSETLNDKTPLKLNLTFIVIDIKNKLYLKNRIPITSLDDILDWISTSLKLFKGKHSARLKISLDTKHCERFTDLFNKINLRMKKKKPINKSKALPKIPMIK